MIAPKNGYPTYNVLFLKLTDAQTGRPKMINICEILSMDREVSGTKLLSNSKKVFIVNESMEKIYSLCP